MSSHVALEQGIYPRQSKKGMRYQVLIMRTVDGQRVPFHRTLDTLEEARRVRDEFYVQHPPKKGGCPPGVRPQQRTEINRLRREEQEEYRQFARTPRVPYSQQAGKLVLRNGRWVLL